MRPGYGIFPARLFRFDILLEDVVPLLSPE